MASQEMLGLGMRTTRSFLIAINSKIRDIRDRSPGIKFQEEESPSVDSFYPFNLVEEIKPEDLPKLRRNDCSPLNCTILVEENKLVLYMESENIHEKIKITRVVGTAEDETFPPIFFEKNGGDMKKDNIFFQLREVSLAGKSLEGKSLEVIRRNHFQIPLYHEDLRMRVRNTILKPTYEEFLCFKTQKKIDTEARRIHSRYVGRKCLNIKESSPEESPPEEQMAEATKEENKETPTGTLTAIVARIGGERDDDNEDDEELYRMTAYNDGYDAAVKDEEFRQGYEDALDDLERDDEDDDRSSDADEGCRCGPDSDQEQEEYQDYRQDEEDSDSD